MVVEAACFVEDDVMEKDVGEALKTKMEGRVMV